MQFVRINEISYIDRYSSDTILLPWLKLILSQSKNPVHIISHIT